MQNLIKFYKVGGHVRDTILGISSKDIDYAVEAPSYEAMRDYIQSHGKIYQERPEFFTIRAKLNGEDCDYVLCRKESIYSDGRHPDSVEMGDIYDDLSRRDFTCNAIAVDEIGNFIDPHGGMVDIEDRVLRCVGRAKDRFNEDSLRLLRAIRFKITKHFDLDPTITTCLHDKRIVNRIQSVSVERVREELFKCFVYDTVSTLSILEEFGALKDAIFCPSGKLFLVPTIYSSR